MITVQLIPVQFLYKNRIVEDGDGFEYDKTHTLWTISSIFPNKLVGTQSPLQLTRLKSALLLTTQCELWTDNIMYA